MVHVSCQLDRITWDSGLLACDWGYADYANYGDKTFPLLVALTPRAEILVCGGGGGPPEHQRASTPPLSDCGYQVSSCFLVPLPWLHWHVRVHLSPWAKMSPFSLTLLSSEGFYHKKRKGHWGRNQGISCGSIIQDVYDNDSTITINIITDFIICRLK